MRRTLTLLLALLVAVPALAADLTARGMNQWYKDILQVSNSNSGVDATLRQVSDGEGTDSALSISTTAVSAANGYSIGADVVLANAGTQNVFVGVGAGNANTKGAVTSVGFYAGDTNTRDYCTFVGWTAGDHNTGIEAVAVGGGALGGNTGASAVAVGFNALLSNTGMSSTAFGGYAGWHNIGANLTAAGNHAGWQNAGSNATFVGVDAGNNQGGDYTVGVGLDTLVDNAGDFNTALGSQAGGYIAGSETPYHVTTGTQNTYVGAKSGAINSTQLSNISVLGYDARASASNQVVLGNASVTEVQMGTGGTANIKLTIPSYANNAAALAAIGAGKLYYTDSAGERIVKISYTP